jgi:hypothetical protein
MKKEVLTEQKKLIKLIEEGVKSLRVTLFGFVLIAIIFKFFLEMPFSYNIFLILILWIFATFPFAWSSKKSKTITKINIIHSFWIIFQLTLITVLVYYLGGIAWIGPITYIFFPIYETFLFGKRQKLLLVISSMSSLTGLAFLQYLRIINPPIVFTGINIHEASYFYATLLIEVGIIIFSTKASLLFRENFEEKREKLSFAYEQLRKNKKFLEKREKELKKRVEELEKFQRLIKGRKSRMKELKERIKELEKKKNN